ncbi:MAG: DUF5050 domain-containing protein [Pseudobutyrivibrio ruminis]|uniref:DUF5050 domain-containing protein n=1 Tax=Pseudobutyrivibrio ruminis TaxID=46206 RepID=UPI0026F296F4|nr:DUF5050 domain-containing protein [Pseudobutyrivibrio ruminis]MBE5914228.1 DUF5050 domain-containing protein [Pseudobutyrivibrio ruminis]
MKVLKRIIILVVAIAIVAGLGFYKYINTVTYYNDPGTNGNTIGNLYGNGLFCETDGVVYFSNPNDSGRIYKMNPDESDIEIVANDSVYFINADSHYLYYSRNHNDNADFVLDVNTESLCRMTKKNKKVIILDQANCNAAALAGNRVVYFHYDSEDATSLYMVGIDGEERVQLSKAAIDPRCMVGETLYYSGVERDHNLHSMNLDTKDSTYVSSENLWLPIIDGNTLYYMNLDENNRVFRSTLSGDNKTGITTYGTSGYNISGNYLYYQSIKGNPDGLYRVDLTTGAELLLAEGEFNNINVTSKYVYFADYYSGTTFHVANGSTEVGLFNPPILALDK